MASPRHILIVERDRAVADMLRDFLESRDYVVTLADTVLGAERVVETDGIEVVLTSVNLTGETTDRLITFAKHKGRQVLTMSGDPGSKVDLRKPFTMRTLMHALEPDTDFDG